MRGIAATYLRVRFDPFSEPESCEFPAILRVFSAIFRAKYAFFGQNPLFSGRPFLTLRYFVCVFAHIENFF